LRQQLIDAFEKCGGVGGAFEIAIDAEFESESFVFGIVVTAGVENERHGLQSLVLFPFLAERESVHLRQQDIADDELRRITTRGLERIHAIVRTNDGMTALAQELLERHLLELAFVGNKDRAHLSVSSRFPRGKARLHIVKART
jgi:hypothetical protein